MLPAILHGRRKGSILIATVLLGMYCCWLTYRWYDCTAVHWAHVHGDSVELLGHNPQPHYPEPSVNKSNKWLLYPITSNDEALVVYDLRLTRREAFCEVLDILGHDDGEKTLCLVDKYIPKSPCLVYSFGVAQDFSFDRAVVSRFGCEVYAFDPSTGLASHIVAKNLYFYNFGVAGANIDNYAPTRGVYTDGKHDHVWKLRTLGTIIREMKHEHRIIDVLKMDIEGWEFQVLEESLKSGVLNSVKQLVVEFHVFGFKEKKRYLDKLRLLLDLSRAGFRIVFTSKHNCPLQCDALCASSYCHQVDVTLVNRNFEIG